MTGCHTQGARQVPLAHFLPPRSALLRQAVSASRRAHAERTQCSLRGFIALPQPVCRWSRCAWQVAPRAPPAAGGARATARVGRLMLSRMHPLQGCMIKHQSTSRTRRPRDRVRLNLSRRQLQACTRAGVQARLARSPADASRRAAAQGTQGTAAL